MRALVTAGGTEEPIDDVRVIANRSTGRFGHAIACALADRGVDVVLLASRELASRDVDPRLDVRPFGSFVDLDAALGRAIAEGPPDLLLMAAAVADYSPVPAAGKLSSDAPELVVTLRRNPKLLATLRERCGPETTLVGFKLTSGLAEAERVAIARRQCRESGLDFTVANDVSELTESAHPVLLVAADRMAPLAGARGRVASALVDALLDRAQATDAIRSASDELGLVPVAWEGRIPGIAQLLRDPGGLLVAPYGGELAIEDDRPAGWHRALGLAGAAGRYRGGSFVLRQELPPAPGNRPVVGLVLGLTRAAVEDLVHDWTRMRSELDAPRGRLAGEQVRRRLIWTPRARLVGVAWEHDASPELGRPWIAPWVAPWARRRGIGDALLRTLENQGHLDVRLASAEHDDFMAARGWTPDAEHRWSPPRRDRVDVEVPPSRPARVRAASACLIDPLQRRVLLGRRNGPPAEGLWAFPGGRIDDGESAQEAAVRELREEAGLAPPDAPPARRRVVYVGGDGPRAPGWEITCVVWLTFETPEPRATEELEARWVDLDQAERLPLTAGTRRVLRLETPPRR